MLGRLIAGLLYFVARGRVPSVIAQAVRRRARKENAKNGCRLVMEVENAMYPLEGWYAKAVGEGRHMKHDLTGFHEFFSNRINPGENVLDVGCGTGLLSRAIATSTGATVVAIDMNEKKLGVARTENACSGVEYIQGKVPDALTGVEFDVVVLSNVLEHFSERVKLLRDLKEKTSAKRFLVRVPAFDRDWRVAAKKEIGVQWRLDSTHETEYTNQSFREEVEEAGLVVVHLERKWGELWSELEPRDI